MNLQQGRRLDRISTAGTWQRVRIMLAFEGEPDRLPLSDLADAAGGWAGKAPLMCFSGLGKRGLRRNVSL